MKVIYNIPQLVNFGRYKSFYTALRIHVILSWLTRKTLTNVSSVKCSWKAMLSFTHVKLGIKSVWGSY